MNAVRPAAVAGMFYPGDKKTLLRDVDLMLNNASAAPVGGEISAMIVPHAGYRYSGATAARAYALLRGLHFDAVVLVGPSHREYFPGISIFPGHAYETPLGPVAIHAAIRNELVHLSPLIHLSEAGHRGEHCLEVQLPFLQRVLEDTPIVPVIMGDQTPELCTSLATAMVALAARNNILLVASTDLSHFHSAPEAVALDEQVVHCLRNFEPDELQSRLESGQVEACGGGPMVAVMTAAKMSGATKLEVCDQTNSGEVTGDRESVVGYVSAVIRKPAA